MTNGASDDRKAITGPRIAETMCPLSSRTLCSSLLLSLSRAHLSNVTESLSALLPASLALNPLSEATYVTSDFIPVSSDSSSRFSAFFAGIPRSTNLATSFSEGSLLSLKVSTSEEANPLPLDASLNILLNPAIRLVSFRFGASFFLVRRRRRRCSGGSARGQRAHPIPGGWCSLSEQRRVAALSARRSRRR